MKFEQIIDQEQYAAVLQLCKSDYRLCAHDDGDMLLWTPYYVRIM